MRIIIDMDEAKDVRRRKAVRIIYGALKEIFDSAFTGGIM